MSEEKKALMDNDFKVIGTKVSGTAYKQLHAIADRAGVKVYHLMQTVIDTYIKTLCSCEPITPAMESVLINFADFSKLKNGFSLSAPNLRNLTASHLLAIVSQPKKTDCEIVLISAGSDGALQSQNNDEILRIFLQAFSPAILRNLQAIQEREGLHTLKESIYFALAAASPERDIIAEEINELFADNERIECEKANREEIGRYKRKITRTIEELDKRPTANPETVYLEELPALQ